MFRGHTHAHIRVALIRLSICECLRDVRISEGYEYGLILREKGELWQTNKQTNRLFIGS